MLFNKASRPSSDKAPSDKDASAPSTATRLLRTKAGKPGDDRYAVLLRRIDDLERVHAEDKKHHHAELDRVKSELARATRTGAEQTERADKLTRQNEAYEARVAELKKASAGEQAEIKALRAKLRTCEHERGQRAAENGDVKKALAGAEARWRDEVQAREAKMAETDKTLVAERTRREMLEACLDDVRKRADEEAAKLRVDSASLQRRLDVAKNDGEDARQAASVAREEAEDREEKLLDQLEYCKMALGRVAEEYAQLASTTVPAKAHETLKEEQLALQSRSLRMERKLANSEAQVTELTHLIRQANEENEYLLDELREAHNEINLYSRLLQERSPGWSDGRNDGLSDLESEVAALGLDIAQDRSLVGLVEYHNMAHGFYCNLADKIWAEVNDLEHNVRQERSTNHGLAEDVARHVALCKASNVEVERLQTELAEVNRRLASEQGTVVQTRQSRDTLQQKINAVEKQLGEQASQHKVALQKEREIAQKHSMQVRMSKTAEDTLKAEMEQLNNELADVARFQDAYYKLLDETEGLLARNDLAEEEAKRLSRFNAEILGHQNPAQRIVYVDRIRRELAETKQQLLACTRERDTLVATNDDLRREIELYTSSVVPMENKPKSLFIRVSRQPSTNQSLNARSQSPTKTILEHLPGPGDMTLDELT